MGVVVRALVPKSSAPRGLVCELCMTPIVDTDRLQDSKVRQGQRLARALLVEAVSAVAAVVLSVGEGECGPAAHADVGIDPFRRL